MAKVDAKVVLLGKEYGGKTSLVERFLHGRFCGDEVPYQNTIGAAYGAKRIDVFGSHVLLGIWDTAGSERYQAMSRIYYRNAWAAVVCYDLTDRASWEKAQFWVRELRQNEPKCRLYFCGTKSDLLTLNPSLRQVEHSQVDDFAAQFAIAEQQQQHMSNDEELTRGRHIFETSSKTGEIVQDVFVQIAKDFLRESKERMSSPIMSGALDLNVGVEGESSNKNRCSNC